MTTITALPSAPNRSTDAPEAYVTKADAMMAALPTFVTETNTVAGEVNTNATTATTQAGISTTQATNSANSASASANSAIASAASATTALNAPGTSATSTTSLTVATGSQSLTIQTGKLFSIGQFVVIARTSAPANYMAGQITAHNSGTGALIVNVTSFEGSGTYTDWTISLNASSLTAASQAEMESGTEAGLRSVSPLRVKQAIDALATSAVNYPQNSKSSNYTFVIGDAGKMIFHPNSDVTSRDWTIPSNASVAFDVGTVIALVAQFGSGRIRLSIQSDTLRTRDGMTGTKVLAANTQYFLLKIASTEWLLSGGDVLLNHQVAVAHSTVPYVSAYPWSVSGFGTKFADPATSPTGTGYGVAFSPAGTEVAVAHNLSPYVSAYPWSVSGFGTKFANPATLPPGAGNSVAFSPAGTEVAVAHDGSPYVSAYPWSVSGFGIKFANPATLPPGTGNGVAFNFT